MGKEIDGVPSGVASLWPSLSNLKSYHPQLRCHLESRLSLCEAPVKRPSIRPAAMARRVLLPAAAPDSGMHQICPHFARVRAVVENQRHCCQNACSKRDDSGTAASLGRKPRGTGRQRRALRSSRAGLLRCDCTRPPIIIFCRTPLIRGFLEHLLLLQPYRSAPPIIIFCHG